MKPDAFNPLRLDVARFARAGAGLEGQVPLQTMQRLCEGTCSVEGAAAGVVTWAARGSLREVPAGAPELRLALQANTTVGLICQRCLQPLAVDLAIDRTFRFARDDEEAAQLDQVAEDEDVLALGRPLDLLSLLEDELIMALPIVPRHQVCPQPLAAWREPSEPGAAEGNSRPAAQDPTLRPHPFAVLGTLKRPKIS